MCLVEFLSPGRVVTDTFIVSCTTRNLDMLPPTQTGFGAFLETFGIWKYIENSSNARRPGNCQHNQRSQAFILHCLLLSIFSNSTAKCRRFFFLSTSWGQKVLLVFFAFSSFGKSLPLKHFRRSNPPRFASNGTLLLVAVNR